MSARKLGRYITSREFSERANAAVAEAVRALEKKGIRPAYIERDLTREKTQAVSVEDSEGRRLASLSNRLAELSRTPTGAHLVDDATGAVARALLLAKTAMPSEETTFLAEIREQLAQVCARPALVEWARFLIEVERRSSDAIRDRAVVDDALFERRIDAISDALAH